MTRKEFLEEVTDVSDLYDFCNENGYYGHVEDLCSADSYNEWLDEEFSEAMRYNTWTEVRDMMNNTDDPYDSDWWVRDDYGEWNPADYDWFIEARDNLLEELEDDSFFDEEEEDDEIEFDVEATAVFLTIM